MTKNAVTSPTKIGGIGVPFTNATVETTSVITQTFGSGVTAPVGADGTFQFTDAAGPDPRFYRVKYP